MRTLLLLFGFGASVLGHGQNTIRSYEYWFNNNFTSLQRQNVSPARQVQLNTNISTADLADGMHLLHLRFRDDSGRYSPTISQFFYKPAQVGMPVNARINAWQYWFDEQHTSAVTEVLSETPALSFNRMIDTDHLPDGLHLFFARFRDNRMVWSPVVPHFFYKLPAGSTGSNLITSFQYWFNGQFQNAVTETITAAAAFSLSSLMPASSLPDGIHLFHIRFRDFRGQWSPVVSSFFYKMPPAIAGGENKITGFEYWFDSQYQQAVKQTVSPESPYQLSGTLPLSSLPPGVHLLHVRFRDQRGQWGSVLSQFVYHESPSASAQGIMKQMQYWFNRDEQQAVMVALPNQTSVQVSQVVNAATLPDGLHLLHLRFADTTGKWTPVISQFFYKSAEFGITNNVITGYRYWFNDAPAGDIVFQPISPANPFSLVTVVDMGCLANGTNRLIMQFRDSTGNWSAPMVDTVNVTVPADKSLRFVGNGNWSNADNWLNKMKPSPNAPGCREIIIDHAAGGSCILDVPQRLLKNAKLIVLPGKKLIIPGNIETAPAAPVNQP